MLLTLNAFIGGGFGLGLRKPAEFAVRPGQLKVNGRILLRLAPNGREALPFQQSDRRPAPKVRHFQLTRVYQQQHLCEVSTGRADLKLRLQPTGYLTPNGAAHPPNCNLPVERPAIAGKCAVALRAAYWWLGANTTPAWIITRRNREFRYTVLPRSQVQPAGIRQQHPLKHQRILVKKGEDTMAKTPRKNAEFKIGAAPKRAKHPESSRVAFLFDLDGTLVDSVYQHVLAWSAALEQAGIQLSVWRIHRRIGMSGGLFVNALLRETGLNLTPKETAHLQQLHAEAYRRLDLPVRPLPGARELLACLTKSRVPWAIATSGRLATAAPALKTLGIPEGVPIITRDQVEYAKPDPDLFLTAAERLNVPIETSIVVGDSVWDLLAARRAHALGVGLLSGGYGQDELERAGAYRVYNDPADLLRHIDEVGVRNAEVASA